MARIAKVLAHPARIAIVQHLVKINTSINSDLVQELGLAPLSYFIDAARWQELKNLLNQLFGQYRPVQQDDCGFLYKHNSIKHTP